MTQALALPRLIQGGMGVGVSDWRLARTVSMRGHLGVVSGTGIDTVLVRRLQDGDIGGHVRRAMAKFPLPRAAEDVLRLYFREGGRPLGAPYKSTPMYRQAVSTARQQLSMLAAFVEVTLAKEGHRGQVGMNLLTKIQLPNLAFLYGAMLAGVDYILMGAGVPREIPGALDLMAKHQTATMRLDLENPTAAPTLYINFDPQVHWDGTPPEIRRPKFLAIIASNSLATMLTRKATGKVDGFVIEGPTGGGHNAPARGELRYNERGEPVYGERDEVDLEKMRQLGVPFWIAGGAGSPDRVVEALEAGAAGVQVGTLFAYSDESGMTETVKRSILAHALRDDVDVFTDLRASPTGYPFKVVRWGGDPAVGVKRQRVCDVGGLRVSYITPQGTVGYRCPAEPEKDYVRKGGKADETEGRKCLCNALMANIGIGQLREDGWVEPPLITSGTDLTIISTFLAGRTHYSANDVIDYLLSKCGSESSGVVPLSVPEEEAVRRE